jgi:hypothetical protein
MKYKEVLKQVFFNEIRMQFIMLNLPVLIENVSEQNKSDNLLLFP